MRACSKPSALALLDLIQPPQLSLHVGSLQFMAAANSLLLLLALLTGKSAPVRKMRVE